MEGEFDFSANATKKDMIVGSGPEITVIDLEMSGIAKTAEQKRGIEFKRFVDHKREAPRRERIEERDYQTTLAEGSRKFKEIGLKLTSKERLKNAAEKLKTIVLLATAG